MKQKIFFLLSLILVLFLMVQSTSKAEYFNGISYYDGQEGGTSSGINSTTAESSAITLTFKPGSTDCHFRNREATGGSRLDIRINGDTTPIPLNPGEGWDTVTPGQPLLIHSFTHQASSNCTACLVWSCSVKN